MTKLEALEWLERHDPNTFDFCIEWIGGKWHAYQWIGPAGRPYKTRKASFVTCVKWIKEYVEKRAADQPAVSTDKST